MYVPGVGGLASTHECSFIAGFASAAACPLVAPMGALGARFLEMSADCQHAYEAASTAFVMTLPERLVVLIARHRALVTAQQLVAVLAFTPASGWLTNGGRAFVLHGTFFSSTGAFVF